MDANLAFTFGLFAGILATLAALLGLGTYAHRKRREAERADDERLRAAFKLQLRAIEATEKGATALAEIAAISREIENVRA